MSDWKSNAGPWLAVLENCEEGLGIPKDLLARQCKEESDFNPQALNKESGAIGIMQLLPKFFEGAGVNPTKDIRTAGQYLASLEKSFGNWQLALAAYDWGPGNLRKWEHAGSKWADLPPETQNYVTQIITDVPVQGALCKILSLQPIGNQPSLSPSAPSSGSSSAKSLFSRATSIFRSHPAPRLESPSADLSPQSVPISFQINQGVNSMSNPNPMLAAAAPTLITAVQELKTCINTILTGDPMQIPLRAGPAATILVAQLQLLIPGLAVAETGVVQTDVNSKLDGLITKLQGLGKGQVTGPIVSPGVPVT
jgi:hypothetical protein